MSGKPIGKLRSLNSSYCSPCNGVDRYDRKPIDKGISITARMLVAHAQGLVTVNSTVGAVSLGLNCPTLTLSDPIYNLPGLTFQGGLDDFWREGDAPDAEFFRRFKNCVIFATQVNGGFYCRKGIDLAASNSARVLSAEKSPLELII